MHRVRWNLVVKSIGKSSGEDRKVSITKIDHEIDHKLYHDVDQNFDHNHDPRMKLSFRCGPKGDQNGAPEDHGPPFGPSGVQRGPAGSSD